MSSQNILEDFQPQDEFAADHGVSEHTIARYRKEPDGHALRVVRRGKSTSTCPGAREWMAKRIRRRAPARTPQGAGATSAAIERVTGSATASSISSRGGSRSAQARRSRPPSTIAASWQGTAAHLIRGARIVGDPTNTPGEMSVWASPVGGGRIP